MIKYASEWWNTSVVSTLWALGCRTIYRQLLIELSTQSYTVLKFHLLLDVALVSCNPESLLVSSHGRLFGEKHQAYRPNHGIIVSRWHRVDQIEKRDIRVFSARSLGKIMLSEKGRAILGYIYSFSSAHVVDANNHNVLAQLVRRRNSLPQRLNQQHYNARPQLYCYLPCSYFYHCECPSSTC